jgi:hypothetical protein
MSKRSRINGELLLKKIQNKEFMSHDYSQQVHYIATTYIFNLNLVRNTSRSSILSAFQLLHSHKTNS